MASVEDRPISAKPNIEIPTQGDQEEDRPLPRGAYNLDNLGPDAFGGAGSDDVLMSEPVKPKKAPPARFAAAAKSKAEETKKPVIDEPIKDTKKEEPAPVVQKKAAVNLDDKPISGKAQPPPT